MNVFTRWILFLLSAGITSIAFVTDSTAKVFGELEVYSPGKVAEGEEVNLKKVAAALVAGGSDSAGYTITTPVAFGGRLGILYPVQDVGDLGISVGYVAGPTSEVKVTDKDPGIGTSHFDYTRELSFVRALFEYRKEFSINDNWAFFPAFGVGMGFGAEKNKVKMATNFFAGDSLESAKWSGLTWEVTSGFAYKMDSSDLTIAVRYAAFPSFKGDTAKGLAKVDWGTIGFSFGLGFGGGRSLTPSAKYYGSPQKTDEHSSKDMEPADPIEPVAAPETSESVESYDTYVGYAEDYVSQGNYSKALNEYDNALALLPPNDARKVYIWERKGSALSEKKDYIKAKGFYAFSIKTAKGLRVSNASVVNAYLGLAYCLEKTANTSDAIRNYEKALQLSTNTRTKARIRKIIQKLKTQS